MDDRQVMYMKAQANAVAEYVKKKRDEGCTLSENDIVKDWISNHAQEFRENWNNMNALKK